MKHSAACHKKTACTDPVQSVVLDWAGTAEDHGCTGPAVVSVNIFAQVHGGGGESFILKNKLSYYFHGFLMPYKHGHHMFAFIETKF